MTWLPFDLHPEYPTEGMPRARLRERYGEAVDHHLAAFFERNGLAFNPPAVMPRSLDALRVTELARDLGLHAPVHDRLMDAVWDEGRDLRDRAVLRELAVEAGLEGDAVDAVIDADAYAERVRASTEQAASLGVTGIPAFLLDRRLLVLGAQPREVFEQAFARLARS